MDHTQYVTSGEAARRATDDQWGSLLRAAAGLVAAIEKLPRPFTANATVNVSLSDTLRDLKRFVDVTRPPTPDPLPDLHLGIATLFREAKLLGQGRDQTPASQLIREFRKAHPKVEVTAVSGPNSASLTLGGPNAAVRAWKKDPRWPRLQDALARLLPESGGDIRTPLPKGYDPFQGVFG